MINKIHVVNGVGTDVGKTFVISKLIKQKVLKSNKKVCILKPIISGFDDKAWEKSDSAILLKSAGIKISKQALSNATLYFLKAPLSPNIASELEGIVISYDAIFDFCKQKIDQALLEEGEIFIEMSGGLFSPITDSKTMFDLTTDIKNAYGNKGCSNILVTSNYIGSISHTIAACMLFDFDEIVFNPIKPSPYDEKIRWTMENLIGKKVTI